MPAFPHLLQQAPRGQQVLPLSAGTYTISLQAAQRGVYQTSSQTFRILVTALVGLGVLGFSVANAASRRLHQTLGVLAGQRSTKNH